MRVAPALVTLACLPVVLQAHHSRSEFSDRTIELEGELLSVSWRNPHPLFRVRAVDDGGQEAEWRLEAYGNALTLQRTGVTGDMFVPGDRVRVRGQASERRNHVLLATHLQVSDGTEAILAYEAEPYWSQRSVGGAASWIVDDAVLRRAAAENRGIFRVWSLPRRGLEESSFQLTEAAAAGRAAFDPLDNYLSRCEPPGMPGLMRNPQPFEFVDKGENILIRAQFFNVERTVHIADAADPASQPASRLGYSVGHWEGDTLVIETTRIDFPYMDLYGTPQSEDIRVLESLTLSDDQSRLDFHMTITDPVSLSEPATFSRYWLALEGEIQYYECVVE